MRVYHFLTEKYGLKVLRERRLKISRLSELNDPFEFLGADLSNPELRKALQRTKAKLSETRGLLCFSKGWHNPVLWGHYADKHRGVSLGFDMPKIPPRKVSYVTSRLSWPPVVNEAFFERLLFTKFSHWSYEDEYRAYLSLDTAIDGIYYADFSDALILKQVIVGPESKITRAQVSAALGDLDNSVEVFKTRAAFRSFRIVRNKKDALWA